MYHFLVESKPHERTSIDYRKREYLPDKKKYSNSNENFSVRKMMKQFGNPPFLREPPSPRFS